MRTAVFVLAMMVHEVAVALGYSTYEEWPEITNLLIIIFFAMIFMDVADFIKGMKNDS